MGKRELAGLIDSSSSLPARRNNRLQKDDIDTSSSAPKLVGNAKKTKTSKPASQTIQKVAKRETKSLDSEPDHSSTVVEPPAIDGAPLETAILTWNLTIKTISGEFSVLATKTWLVEDLKQAIFNSQGIPPEFQRLQFDGKLLENGRNLTDYGVEELSKIYLVLRMRGA